MRNGIKLSKEATHDMRTLKQRLRLSGQDDLIVLRIAFGRSLQQSEDPIFEREPSRTEDKKKEIKFSTLEQGHHLLFRALLNQKYQQKISDYEYPELVKDHIEHGLWTMMKETERLSGYDYLINVAQAIFEKEGEQIMPSKEQNVSTFLPNVINVNIGKEKNTNNSITYPINVHSNPHFAIIGGSGAGKTYFIKHLLTEIRKQSNYQTHFIIFDYKDGDIANDRNFVRRTKAKVINVKKSALPLNLFWDTADEEKEQKACAERIINIIRDVEANIGKVQEHNLYLAIESAFKRYSPYPDFHAIRAELESVSSKPDSLTSVLRPLTDQEYFAKTGENIYKSWIDKTLVIDIHEIEKKELICFFVLNQIHKELKKLGTAPINQESNARQIRIVVVIDEAHYFLGDKKRAKILQNMIRDVRSSGGAIVLASQSPDDYDKADFDFLELMEFPIVLKSTPKSHKFLQQKFALNPTNAKSMLKKLSLLDKGEAYVLHDKVVKRVDLCK